LLKLGLAYHLAYDFPRSRQAYQQGFDLWQQAASRPQSSLSMVEGSASRPFRAASGDPRTLDPCHVSDMGTGEFSLQLFEGLASLTPEADIVPAVAHSWDVLEGGQRYVFRLRPDARWSDETPLTAHDFVFAWRRTLDPATASPNASLLYDVRGARLFHAGENTDPASLGVSAPDDWTLLVELDEPVGYFIHLMAHLASFPVPRHALQAHGEAWATPQRLVCNGPFRLAAWEAGKALTLERNPFYTGPFSGNLQSVEFDLVYDRERFQARYEADELDLVGLSVRNVERMRYRYPGEYITFPAPGLSFIGFNQSHPPLNDPLVRQALAYATDRAALVNLLAHGYPMPAAGGFLPPGIPGYSPDSGLAYDPERAQALLAQAGYPGGQGFPELVLHTLFSKDLDSRAELIQRTWKEILGVSLQITQSDLLESFQTTDMPGLWYITWVADYPDPDNFLRVALGYYHILKYWNNPEFNRLVTDARRCQDPQNRARMYRDADRLLTQDAVLLPLTYVRHHLLVKPWVKNFRPGLHHFYFLKDVILEA
jgi:oligopeptide transport system substrate-binding protein